MKDRASEPGSWSPVGQPCPAYRCREGPESSGRVSRRRTAACPPGAACITRRLRSAASIASRRLGQEVAHRPLRPVSRSWSNRTPRRRWPAGVPPPAPWMTVQPGPEDDSAATATCAARRFPPRSADPVQDGDVVGDRRAAHVEDAAERGARRPACRRPRRMSCMAVSTCIETPVAPIGWPLDFRPPDGLTGSRPSFARPALQRPRAALRRAAPGPSPRIRSVRRW